MRVSVPSALVGLAAILVEEAVAGRALALGSAGEASGVPSAIAAGRAEL